MKIIKNDLQFMKIFINSNPICETEIAIYENVIAIIFNFMQTICNFYEKGKTCLITCFQ